MWLFKKKPKAQSLDGGLSTGGTLSFGAALHGEVLRPAPVKPAEARETLADEMDAICAALGARYEIRRPDGDRLILINLPNGDVFSGRGATMTEAFAMVKDKAVKLQSLQEGAR